MPTFIPSGGVTSVGSAEITNDSIVNEDINSAAAIAFSKLATLASGNILVGNGSGVAASVAVSGPVTISNAGVTSLSFTGYTGAIATSSTDGLVLSGNGGADTLNLSNTTAGVGITIGGDCQLYRSAADTWKTDDNLIVNGAGRYVHVLGAGENSTLIGYKDGSTAAAGFALGQAYDTNLYRSAADTLKTDDKLHVVGEIELDGALNHDGSTAGFFAATPVTQQAAVTAPAGGAFIDAESRTAINDIITKLENYGLLVAN
jgi:hypothetical protein